jgi:hypothetical protein
MISSGLYQPAALLLDHGFVNFCRHERRHVIEFSVNFRCRNTRRQRSRSAFSS